MSDGLGYFQQIQGGIYGQPDGGNSDPVSRAALQEQYAQMAAAMTTVEGHVALAEGYQQSAPEWASQPGGPANVPISGWTAQNSTGPAFHQPYVATDMGRIPDWTSDSNALAAGQYDMNIAVRDTARNDLNQAPVGDNESLFNYMQPSPPSTPTEDISGSVTLEW